MSSQYQYKPLHEAEVLVISALRQANLTGGKVTLATNELRAVREYLFDLTHQSAALVALVDAIDRSGKDDDDDDKRLEMALRLARAAIARTTRELTDGTNG